MHHAGLFMHIDIIRSKIHCKASLTHNSYCHEQYKINIEDMENHRKKTWNRNWFIVFKAN